MDIISFIKKSLSQATVTADKKDIIVKSKDRENTKVILEKALKAKNIKFKSVFKKSKSSSLDVLEIAGHVGDIIFKPIIQKGAGGVGFEKELKLDLENYFNGVNKKDLRHGDVVVELEKVLKITPRSGYKVIHEGSKNQKRLLTYTPGKLSVSNSTGITLTDITLERAGKRVYLSLKMSKSYYILSASIFNYFLDKKLNSSLCEYLGLNGAQMGGFGKEYYCITKKPNYNMVRANIEKFLSIAYGSNVVIIHKKMMNNVMVSDIKSSAAVKVSGLDDKSYIYPEAGKRKYAAIKFNADINKHKYIVNFQFRGTTATDTGPKYIRILMERL
jgi:hypothetical protein